MSSRVLAVFWPIVVFPLCLARCVQNSSDVLVLDCIVEQLDVSKRPEPDSTVNVSMFVKSISSPGETSLDYSFHVELTHYYVDGRLQYDVGNNSALKGMLMVLWFHFITAKKRHETNENHASKICDIFFTLFCFFLIRHRPERVASSGTNLAALRCSHRE